MLIENFKNSCECIEWLYDHYKGRLDLPFK